MFVLKSSSPRRIQILNDLGLDFKISPSAINENEIPGEKPIDYLHRVVSLKLGQKTEVEDDQLFLAVDTIVVYENKILHKPQSISEAVEILLTLSNQKHQVQSGAILASNGHSDFFWETTEITFQNWTQKDAEAYVEKYQPFDKAGSYGIQDRGGPVKKREGSYLNVLGFPMRSFLQRHTLWTKYLKN